MLYCIEVDRGGIREESFVLHHSFDKEPTKEQIFKLLDDEDCGWDEDYCKAEWYKVG